MEESEFVIQLKRYFIGLTQTQFTKSFGEESGRELLETFRIKFDEIYKLNEYRMPDELARKHGINSVFVLAMEETLRNRGVSYEELKHHILSIYRMMLTFMVDEYKNQIETSEDPWQVILEYTEVGNQNNYENEYFNLETIAMSDDEISFDIHRCVYFEILEANEHPELGPILCEFDYIISEATSKWARFVIEETIADGYPRCTFRFFRVNK